jgi:hypothetical protein
MGETARRFSEVNAPLWKTTAPLPSIKAEARSQESEAGMDKAETASIDFLFFWLLAPGF